MHQGTSKLECFPRGIEMSSNVTGNGGRSKKDPGWILKFGVNQVCFRGFQSLVTTAVSPSNKCSASVPGKGLGKRIARTTRSVSAVTRTFKL